jgi:RNA polymerase sigma factor (sigma-70 family)
MRDEDFERLYAEHAGPLLGFLQYRTGDSRLAEDLVADTFERVLRARWRFDRRRASEKTWIYSIALNLVRDQARRSKAEERAVSQVAPAGGRGGEVDFEAVGDRDLVLRGIAGLTPEEREAIALRYGAELTVPEIARITEQRAKTIEGRVYRALGKLRDSLE